MQTNETTFKPETIVKIANSFSRCNLDALGLYNFSFGKEAKRIYEGLAKNVNLKLVAIQDLDVKSNSDVELLVKYFVKTPSLRMLAVGAKIDNYEDSQKAAELILKANPKVEGVLIGWSNIK